MQQWPCQLFANIFFLTTFSGSLIFVTSINTRFMNYSRLQLRSKKSISKSINAKKYILRRKLLYLKYLKGPKNLNLKRRRLGVIVPKLHKNIPKCIGATCLKIYFILNLHLINM